MLQVFRSYQVAGVFILLGFAALLRSAAFVVGVPTDLEGIFNPWGYWLQQLWSGGGLTDWLAGVILVASIGFGASYALQHYRLASAGMLPGFIAVLLGSASWWWLGFTPLLIGNFLVGYAVYRLFECYRHQGVTLPVFDTGLLIGCAWLIAPSFLWFVPAAIIGLAQLRGFRFTDLFGMLVGVLVPAFLHGIYRYLTGSLDSFLWIEDGSKWKLTESFFEIPEAADLLESWPWLSVLVLVSFLAFVGVAKLTTRRPIQEQRFNRLIYMFLGAGWLAILFGGPVHPWALSYVLFPLSLLLGIWLSELSRKQADIASMTALLLVVAGFLWKAIV